MTEPIDVPGPDHRAEPVLTPAKAGWRTVLQVGPAAILSLVVILPMIIEDIVDGFGRQLPDELRVWLLGAALFLTTVAAVAARIMARKEVLDWFTKYAPFFALPKK